jgi:predicted nucleic acid-binding protein
VTAYVDTSVLLRIALGERDPLRGWRTVDVAISSELARVEALRSIDRARIAFSLPDEVVAQRRSDVLSLLDACRLVPLDSAVLDRSAQPFPTSLATLEAMHLSTALLVRPEYPEIVFATHDRALAVAARAVGFRVLGARR